MMRIVVIGDDLHGLMAAYAAALHFGTTGYTIAMLAPGDGQHIVLDVPGSHDYVTDGVQFEPLGFNAALAGMLQTWQLETSVIGDPKDWAAKIGCRPDRFGLDFAEGVQTVRSARGVIMALQPLAGQIVTGWNAHEISLDKRLEELDPTLIVNTIDRSMICQNPDDHRFTRRRYFIGPQGPTIDAGRVLLNAGRDLAFYQRMNFGGISLSYWTEKPPISMIEERTAPVSKSCDCGQNMLHLGPEATYDINETYTTTFQRMIEYLQAVT